MWSSAQRGPRRKTLVAFGSLVSVVGSIAALRSRLPVPERQPAALAALNPESPVHLKEYLSECRSYSGLSGGLEADWGKAERACAKALDLDPINIEANKLFKRVKLEQGAFDLYTRALSALERLDEMQAIQLLTRLPEDSIYFRKAKPQALEIKGRAKAQLQSECTRYARAHAWQHAAVSCERYIALACQDMAQEQLNPPAGAQLSLYGPIRKGNWRPTDSMYLAFLRARQKVAPAALPWRCPDTKLLRQNDKPPQVREQAKNALSQRFAEKRMAEALFTYWEGNAQQAISALQRLRDDPKRSDFHSAAEELRKQIWLVSQLYRTGQGALHAHDPERAEKPFREALQRDQSLMSQLEQWPSFFERSIRRDMARQSYQRGKFWADRGDARRACRIWKVGYEFSHSALPLLQALKHCSERGGELLETAQHCGELATAAELSVMGDGLLQRIQARKAALRCP